MHQCAGVCRMNFRKTYQTARVHWREPVLLTSKHKHFPEYRACRGPPQTFPRTPSARTGPHGASIQEKSISSLTKSEAKIGLSIFLQFYLFFSFLLLWSLQAFCCSCCLWFCFCFLKTLNVVQNVHIVTQPIADLEQDYTKTWVTQIFTVDS